MDGWMDGQKGGKTVEWIDGQTDGLTDRVNIISTSFVFLAVGEHLLLQSDPSSTHQTVKLSPSSPTDLTFLKALFIDLEGPMFEYHSLFGEETHEAVSEGMNLTKEGWEGIQTII